MQRNWHCKGVLRYEVGEFIRNQFQKLLISNEKSYLEDWILLGKKEQGQVEVLWYKDQNPQVKCHTAKRIWMALLLSLPNYLQAVADDTWVTGVYAKMWLYTTANDGDPVFITGAAQGWSRHKFLMLRTQEEYLLGWERHPVDNWDCTSVKKYLNYYVFFHTTSAHLQ